MPDHATGSGHVESRPDWCVDIRARLSTLSIAPSREAEIVEELSSLAGRFLFGLDSRDARAYGVAMATLIATRFSQ